MDLVGISQLVRNTGRFREVVTILAKHGLADWLANSPVETLRNYLRRAPSADHTGTSAEERVRLTITELGTTYIKLGQILSTRPDLVGPELAEELSKLQNQTPCDPPEAVHALIEEELGRPVDECFASFDDIPIASASIGQVHGARLHDGREVVVKVQHPGIEDRIRNDLEIMLTLAELAEHYSSQLRQYRPIETAKQFQRTLLAELDFGREQRNLRLFRRNFRSNNQVTFPEPASEFSSRRILTMTRLNGTSVADYKSLRGEGHDLSEISSQAARVFLDMVFRDGFYHADPHPGNILVTDDKRLGMLDGGMVGRIDETLREQIEDILIAVVDQDSNKLSALVVRMGQVPPDFDEESMRGDIADFVVDYGDQSLQDFDVSGALSEMTQIIHRYQIVLPSKIALIFKVLIMLEGSFRELNPNFSLAELLKPYQYRIIQRRLSPRRLARKIRRTMRDWDHLAGQLPGELSDILTQVKRGRFDVHLEHRRLETTVNRLALGIVTAALFMGSAIMWSRDVPPTWGTQELSIPGATGCLLSLFLGWRLLRAIKRTGNIDSQDSV